MSHRSTPLVTAGFGALDHHSAQVLQMATLLTMAGAPCGGADPARVSNASLNVPVVGAWQVATGFDSVWVSELHDNKVDRIDPASGEVLATIEVGSTPFKLQPAGGRAG